MNFVNGYYSKDLFQMQAFLAYNVRDASFVDSNRWNGWYDYGVKE